MITDTFIRLPFMQDEVILMNGVSNTRVDKIKAGNYAGAMPIFISLGALGFFLHPAVGLLFLTCAVCCPYQFKYVYLLYIVRWGILCPIVEGGPEVFRMAKAIDKACNVPRETIFKS